MGSGVFVGRLPDPAVNSSPLVPFIRDPTTSLSTKLTFNSLRPTHTPVRLVEKIDGLGFRWLRLSAVFFRFSPTPPTFPLPDIPSLSQVSPFPLQTSLAQVLKGTLRFVWSSSLSQVLGAFLRGAVLNVDQRFPPRLEVVSLPSPQSPLRASPAEVREGQVHRPGHQAPLVLQRGHGGRVALSISLPIFTVRCSTFASQKRSDPFSGCVGFGRLKGAWFRGSRCLCPGA